MAKPLLPDELWELIRPLIPPHPPQPKGGRPFLDDRKVLTGIIFLLKTGLPWEDLPQEMGCGCGMTGWNRWRDWQAAGVWDQIHQVLLAHLRHTGTDHRISASFDRLESANPLHDRGAGGAGAFFHPARRATFSCGVDRENRMKRDGVSLVRSWARTREIMATIVGWPPPSRPPPGSA